MISLELERSGARFNAALAELTEATTERREAIIAAARDGWTPARIARAAGASHETVRRVVRSAEGLMST